jgi:3-dehydroquinate synthase
MQADDFMALMVRDKKVLDGQLRLVLLESIGTAVVTADFSLQGLEKILTKACHR